MLWIGLNNDLFLLWMDMEWMDDDFFLLWMEEVHARCIEPAFFYSWNHKGAGLGTSVPPSWCRLGNPAPLWDSQPAPIRCSVVVTSAGNATKPC